VAATLHHLVANVEVEVSPETLRGIVGIGVLAPTVEELVNAASEALKTVDGGLGKKCLLVGVILAAAAVRVGSSKGLPLRMTDRMSELTLLLE